MDRKLRKELEAAGLERIDPVGQPFDPSLHEAVSTMPPPTPDQDHTVSATFQTGLPLQGHAGPPRAGAGVLRPGTGLTWPRRTSIRSSAFPTRRARTRSRRPTAGWPSSTIPTPIRTTRPAAERFKEISEAHSVLSDAGQAEAVRPDAPAGRVRRRLARGAARRWRRAAGRRRRAGGPRRRGRSTSATSAGWATSSRRSSARGRREEPRGETLEAVVEVPVPGRDARRQGPGHPAGHRAVPTCAG